MFHLSPSLLLKITNGSLCHRSFVFNYFQSSLVDQHDHHYMYRSYDLYLVKHFVVALTNVCTVKLAQLHYLIRFKSALVIICPAGVKLHHTWEKYFSIFLDNSFIKLPESNLKIWEKQELI